MASSSASRAGCFCLSRRRIDTVDDRVRPRSKGIGRRSCILERHGQRFERRRRSRRRSPRAGARRAGGHGERPRPLQGASPFLEPLDDLGRFVVRSELDQRHRVIGDEREHRGFSEPRAAMELPCALEMVASDRTRCRATARGRRARTARGAPRPRRRSARDASIASIACDLAASASPRWASTSANAPSLLPCAGARTTLLRRWSSDATQSPARNSIHPSSACRTAARIVVARLDRFVEERRAHRAALVDLARPRQEVRDADARASSDGARLRRRLELERLRHERPVDALSQPHLRGDERRERVGQRIGIVHRSGEPQRLLGIVQRGRQVSEGRERGRAPHVDRAPDIGGDRILSERLRQDVDGPAFVVADHEGPPQSEERLRQIRPGRSDGHDGLEERERRVVVAGEQPVLGGGTAQTAHVGDPVGWREPLGQLAELGGGRGGSAGARPSRRVLQGRRGGLVRTVRRQRQMPGALLAVVHHLAQATMDPVAVLPGALGIDRRAVDGVRERDRPAVSLARCPRRRRPRAARRPANVRGPPPTAPRWDAHTPRRRGAAPARTREGFPRDRERGRRGGSAGSAGPDPSRGCRRGASRARSPTRRTGSRPTSRACRCRIAGGKLVPRRARTSSASSSTDSGSIESASDTFLRQRAADPERERRRRAADGEQPADRLIGRVAGARTPAPPSSRRSSHWTSSSAMSTGPCVAASRKTVSAAAYTARGSGGGPTGSARRRATSRASSCGAGSRSKRSRVPSNRSASPANASVASDSAGRIDNTRQPRPTAAATPRSQSVVFPIPDPPSSTRAAGPSTSPSRNASIRESSSTLPTTWFRLMGASGVIAVRPMLPLTGHAGQTPPIRGLSRVLQPCPCRPILGWAPSLRAIGSRRSSAAARWRWSTSPATCGWGARSR